MQRSRTIYFGFAVLTIAAGLWSRRYRAMLPGWVGSYAGDALWAAMVFFLMGMIWKRGSTFRIAAAALLFSFAIEWSQLYQAVWINDLRNTRLGGLILGYGFLASDLVCYAVGISAAAGLDRSLHRPKNPDPPATSIATRKNQNQ